MYTGDNGGRNHARMVPRNPAGQPDWRRLPCSFDPRFAMDAWRLRLLRGKFARCSCVCTPFRIGLFLLMEYVASILAHFCRSPITPRWSSLSRNGSACAVPTLAPGGAPSSGTCLPRSISPRLITRGPKYVDGDDRSLRVLCRLPSSSS
jgi:hypothetical protein